jgi:hypothetical protein
MPLIMPAAHTWDALVPVGSMMCWLTGAPRLSSFGVDSQM